MPWLSNPADKLIVQMIKNIGNKLKKILLRNKEYYIFKLELLFVVILTDKLIVQLIKNVRNKLTSLKTYSCHALNIILLPNNEY